MIRYLLLLALALPTHAAQFSVLLDDALLPCTVGADRIPKCTAPPPVYVPPVGPISCPGFSKTITVSAVVPANGTPFVRYYTDERPGGVRGGFPGDAALVVVFRAPDADPIFQIGITHTGTPTGPQSTRTITLSTKPCDFAYPASPEAVWAAQSTVMALKLRSNDDARYARYKLEPGRTYYVNMASRAGAQQCVGRCDVYVSILNNAP